MQLLPLNVRDTHSLILLLFFLCRHFLECIIVILGQMKLLELCCWIISYNSWTSRVWSIYWIFWVLKGLIIKCWIIVNGSHHIRLGTFNTWLIGLFVFSFSMFVLFTFNKLLSSFLWKKHPYTLVTFKSIDILLFSYFLWRLRLFIELSDLRRWQELLKLLKELISPLWFFLQFLFPVVSLNTWFRQIHV